MKAYRLLYVHMYVCTKQATPREAARVEPGAGKEEEGRAEQFALEAPQRPGSALQAPRSGVGWVSKVCQSDGVTEIRAGAYRVACLGREACDRSFGFYQHLLASAASLARMSHVRAGPAAS